MCFGGFFTILSFRIFTQTLRFRLILISVKDQTPRKSIHNREYLGQGKKIRVPFQLQSKCSAEIICKPTLNPTLSN